MATKTWMGCIPKSDLSAAAESCLQQKLRLPTSTVQRHETWNGITSDDQQHKSWWPQNVAQKMQIATEEQMDRMNFEE
jgi:hypothetical protein